MEQNNTKLSPKTAGVIAALSCFIVLALIYFFTIGRSMMAGSGVAENAPRETVDVY